MNDFFREFFALLSALVFVALAVALVVYHSGTTADIGAGSQAFNSALATATFQQSGGIGNLGGLSSPSSINLTGFGG
jgi:hypothetical protein